MTTKLLMGMSLAIAMAFASASFAQNRPVQERAGQDKSRPAQQQAAQDKASQKFLTEAIEGNLAEVQMGELAQKNGNSDGVRSFGQMLQKDHSEANQKATAAASSLGMTPPTAPNSKQKADYDRMAKLTGAKFDQEFVKHMIADHKKDIREYDNEAKKKTDAAASYAKEALPTLHKHLETAQSLAGAATTGKR
jgi:putative membrane protein